MRIGFDIGGTKVEICIIDTNGVMIFRHRKTTPPIYTELLTLIHNLVNLAEKEVQHSTPSIGIGLPGTVSPATGSIKNSNLLFLNGKNLTKDLNNLLNRQIHIANDANCFVLSEAVDGAARDGHLVFGAILGTGCGGGIVIDKTPLIGNNAICGEWGHNPLPNFSFEQDGTKRQCYCGRINCIEQFISGSGFELSYQKLTGETLPAKNIVKQIQKDEYAKINYTNLIDQMARSFASIVNILDPDTIVLGGGLSNVDSLYQDLPRAMRPYVFSDYFDTKIVKAKYGDSSGVRGAAWLNNKT